MDERDYKAMNEKLKRALSQHDVILCTYCEKEVIETELTYSEDAEPAHIKCLENFNKHWEDRNETIDLMGY